MPFFHKISYIMNLVLWNNYTLVLVWTEPASSSERHEIQEGIIVLFLNTTIHITSHQPYVSTLLCSWILMEQLHMHQPSPWIKCGEAWIQKIIMIGFCHVHINYPSFGNYETFHFYIECIDRNLDSWSYQLVLNPTRPRDCLSIMFPATHSGENRMELNTCCPVMQSSCRSRNML